jgi:hypothetical protein
VCRLSLPVKLVLFSGNRLASQAFMAGKAAQNKTWKDAKWNYRVKKFKFVV